MMSSASGGSPGEYFWKSNVMGQFDSVFGLLHEG